MPTSGSLARLRSSHVFAMATNSVLRVVSVGLRSLLTIALAVWLEPSEMGFYGLIVATLLLTTYFYGLDFHTFSLREISSAHLAEVRLRIRDQFAMLLLIYTAGGATVGLLLTQFGFDQTTIVLVVALAAAQHAGLEFYRIMARVGYHRAAITGLLIRDAAWVPACFLIKVATGDLSLTNLLLCWLTGSLLSVAYGALLLAQRLPKENARPINWAWLASGLRTGSRMLVGTLSLVALFSVDRMIFAALASPEELGAYAFFGMACFSLLGVFETAVLPQFWAPLLDAAKQGDVHARREAERKLARACLIAVAVGSVIAVAAVTILASFLPHPAYSTNLHLLYYIVAAYALLTLTNIPHYRLFASRRDTLIVTANIAAFAGFLIMIPFLAQYDRPTAVPAALVLACAALLGLKWMMALRAVPAPAV